MHGGGLREEHGNLAPERRHEHGVPELANQSHGRVWGPRQKIEDNNNHRYLGYLNLHVFLLLVGTDLGVHLFGGFLHFLLVQLYRPYDHVVADENYRQGRCEPEEVEEDDIRTVVLGPGQVVESTRRLETFGNVAAPTENWREARSQRPDPDDNEHEERPLAGHELGNVDWAGDSHVAIYGDHGVSVDGHYTEYAA